VTSVEVGRDGWLHEKSGGMVREERTVGVSRLEQRTGGIVPRHRRKRARAAAGQRTFGDQFRWPGGISVFGRGGGKVEG
jgi:hypothetical protein